MMQLDIAGTRHIIAAGETIVGSAPDAALMLGGEGVRPRHAVLLGSPVGAAIRAADAEAEVLLNGVRVGADPTPVLHGDRILIGGHELIAVDPTRTGNTQLFDSGAFADLLPRGRPPAAPAVNGRIVCLTDGREYRVREQLVFGRDAGSDVVVTGTDVSRRHAEIRPGPSGYVLTDSSANGTFVNGARTGPTHPLARADVIRIGNDEFRFYADAAPEGGGLSAGQPVGPPPGAAERLSDTMHAMPVFDRARLTPAAGPPTPPAMPAAGRPTPPAMPAPLASLLVRAGELRGRRLPIRSPAATIGRADSNDVVIADPSVSTVHARLERREAVWSLTDCGSTNGTFVDGEAVSGETPLGPGATLRFGDVSVLFEPLDETPEPGRSRPAAEAAPAGPASRPRPVRPPRAEVPAPGGVPVWLIVVIVAVLALVAFLLLS